MDGLNYCPFCGNDVHSYSFKSDNTGLVTCPYCKIEFHFENVECLNDVKEKWNERTNRT